jgi:hypothetical protein
MATYYLALILKPFKVHRSLHDPHILHIQNLLAELVMELHCNTNSKHFMGT